ncbi:MAG: hypothetical protein SGI96_21165 [Bacteroidota bacterium]|nr:hypothetical protein [Bacteroidota bacterium]
MSLSKSLYRTSLTPAKKTALLKKIRIYAAAKNSRFSVRKGRSVFKGNELADFTIDENATLNTLMIDTGDVAKGVIPASAIVQDLTYTAKQVGQFYANDATIEYIDPGTDGVISVGVIGRKISVTLAYSVGAVTSDADQVKAAIEGYAPANALVSMVVSGVGVTVQSAQIETGLAGGSSSQNFDKADILKIRRLRSKKYQIVIAEGADIA